MANSIINYVTTNTGKFREVEDYINECNPDITLHASPIETTEIQTLDQKAIALDKAIKAWNILYQPVLVDDSGIFFSKYNQFPGTMSKFVMQGIGFSGYSKLIETGDKAIFILTMVFVDESGEPHLFEGATPGSLIKPPSSYDDVSLPYDAFFIPEGETRTYAQLRENFPQNAHYFYRIRALKKFLTWYNQQ